MATDGSRYPPLSSLMASVSRPGDKKDAYIGNPRTEVTFQILAGIPVFPYQGCGRAEVYTLLKITILFPLLLATNRGSTKFFLICKYLFSIFILHAFFTIQPHSIQIELHLRNRGALIYTRCSLIWKVLLKHLISFLPHGMLRPREH